MYDALPGLIPSMNVSSAVSHSQTSPGARKAKEKKDYKRNQAPDCDIFRDGTTSARRTRRLIWATCLIRGRRTLILRLGLVGIGLRLGGAAERRATICAKLGAIRIRQSTVGTVHCYFFLSNCESSTARCNPIRGSSGRKASNSCSF